MDLLKVFDHLAARQNSPNRSRYIRTKKLILGFAEINGLTAEYETITEGFGEDFIHFLKSEYEYSPNTIITYLSKLKAVMNYGLRHNFHTNHHHKYINQKTEISDFIYLSYDEILKIFRTETKAIHVRDSFVLGCLTGQRFSDYSQFSQDKIEGNHIRIRQKKTGQEVFIPLHWAVKDIIKRHGDFPDPKSIQNFNKVIKNIAKQAGITQNIVCTHTKGYNTMTETTPKNELISSHTARRSCGTNMILAGFSTHEVMLLLGHKTEREFLRYIRISGEQNAKKLAEHPFFKDRNFSF